MEDPLEPLGEGVERALLEEATKKSALIWIALPSLRRPRAVWHVWLDGAAYVVAGGIEQPLPGIEQAKTVEVSVRSKDTGALLMTWSAEPSLVQPGSEEWGRVVPELHAKRLNPPDGEAQPQRWARDSRVWRLAPTGQALAAPGRFAEGSGAAPPAPSNATTVGPLPFTIGRTPKHRRIH